MKNMITDILKTEIRHISIYSNEKYVNMSSKVYFTHILKIPKWLQLS